jgi:PleD family two-component response regulator
MNERKLHPSIFEKEKRILVVYKNYCLIEPLIAELSRVKIKLDVFSDPASALRNYVIRHYNLLLVETRLSQMSGFEFSSLITKIEKIGVCFITPMDSYYKSLIEFYPNLKTNCFISPYTSLENFKSIIMSKLYNG